MNKRPCPNCSEGFLTPQQKSIIFTYQGHQYRIPKVTVHVCDKCHEDVIQAKEIRRMESIAKQKQQAVPNEQSVNPLPVAYD
jgi:YgiT-type zinc finger domain-containing protein